jgi:hypothetical protein
MEETLEQAAEVKFANEIQQLSDYDKGRWYGRIEGANWAQERMFEFIEWIDSMGYTQVNISFWKSYNDEKGKTTKELFEQFKTK